MSKKDKIEHMKSSLRTGAIVISSRKSGKTEALVEIYHEDKDAAVVLPSGEGYKQFVEFYEFKYGKNPDLRFLSIAGLKFDDQEYREKILANKKVYVDELYDNPYSGPFHSAITSYPQPVVIIKDESGAV